MELKDIRSEHEKLINLHSLDNPGCYHEMLDYLSRLSGIPVKKQVEFTSINQLYFKIKNGKTKLAYKAYRIKVIDEKGSSHPFHTDSKRFDQRGIIAVRFIVEVNRQIEEFGCKVELAGKYSDSLGGGWSSPCQRYRVNEQYFADMECSCG